MCSTESSQLTTAAHWPSDIPSGGEQSGSEESDDHELDDISEESDVEPENVILVTEDDHSIHSMQVSENDTERDHDVRMEATSSEDDAKVDGPSQSARTRAPSLNKSYPPHAPFGISLFPDVATGLGPLPPQFRPMKADEMEDEEESEEENPDPQPPLFQFQPPQENVDQPDNQSLPFRPMDDVQPGDSVDAIDFQEKWFRSRIISVNRSMEPPQALVHYIGWTDKWDTWLRIPTALSEGSTEPSLPVQIAPSRSIIRQANTTPYRDSQWHSLQFACDLSLARVFISLARLIDVDWRAENGLSVLCRESACDCTVGCLKFLRRRKNASESTSSCNCGHSAGIDEHKRPTRERKRAIGKEEVLEDGDEEDFAGMNILKTKIGACEPAHEQIMLLIAETFKEQCPLRRKTEGVWMDSEDTSLFDEYFWEDLHSGALLETLQIIFHCVRQFCARIMESDVDRRVIIEFFRLSLCLAFRTILRLTEGEDVPDVESIFDSEQQLRALEVSIEILIYLISPSYSHAVEGWKPADADRFFSNHGRSPEYRKGAARTVWAGRWADSVTDPAGTHHRKISVYIVQNMNMFGDLGVFQAMLDFLDSAVLRHRNSINSPHQHRGALSFRGVQLSLYLLMSLAPFFSSASKEKIICRVTNAIRDPDLAPPHLSESQLGCFERCLLFVHGWKHFQVTPIATERFMGIVCSPEMQTLWGVAVCNDNEKVASHARSLLVSIYCHVYDSCGRTHEHFLSKKAISEFLAFAVHLLQSHKACFSALRLCPNCTRWNAMASNAVRIGRLIEHVIVVSESKDYQKHFIARRILENRVSHCETIYDALVETDGSYFGIWSILTSLPNRYALNRLISKNIHRLIQECVFEVYEKEGDIYDLENDEMKLDAEPYESGEECKFQAPTNERRISVSEQQIKFFPLDLVQLICEFLPSIDDEEFDYLVDEEASVN
eukprot:213018_1